MFAIFKISQMHVYFFLFHRIPFKLPVIILGVFTVLRAKELFWVNKWSHEQWLLYFASSIMLLLCVSLKEKL